MFENLVCTLGSLDSQLMALGTKAFVKKEEVANELRYDRKIKEAEKEKRQKEKEEEKKAKEKEEEAKKAKGESTEDNEEEPVKAESYLQRCLRRHAEMNLPEGKPLPVASAEDDEFESIEEIEAAIEEHKKDMEKAIEEMRDTHTRLAKTLEERKKKQEEEEAKAKAEEAKSEPETVEELEKRLREEQLELARLIKELQDKTVQDRAKVEEFKKQKAEEAKAAQTQPGGMTITEFIREDGNGNPIGKKAVTPEDVDAAVAANNKKKK